MYSTATPQVMKQHSDSRDRVAAPAKRVPRAFAISPCSPIPRSAKQLEQSVQDCIRTLDDPLRKSAQKYSPPVLILALAVQLNRLGQAHVSAGLLTTDSLRKLVKGVC